MPKPFFNNDNAGWHLTPDAPVHRPLLGLDVARIASFWSDVELHWSVAYAYLLVGKNEIDAFAAYYSLRDWRKRRKLFFEQVKIHRLPPDVRDEALDLYAEFESLAVARNRIIHGAWAWSEKAPDSIFLAQPSNLGVQLNRVFTGIEKIANRPDRYKQVSVNLAKGHYEEWTHADFEDEIKKIFEFRGKVDALGSKVLAHSLEALLRKLKPRP
jgi:hypothetical protein